VNINDVRSGPARQLINPDESVVVLIDYQPQMFFGTTNADRGEIINAALGLGKAAKVFDVPVILTTVAAETFSGPMLPPLIEAFPDQETIDRTTMNAWEDPRVVDAVKATGRTRIVMAGLWTEVCIATASLSALEQGYQVYVPTDACGGVSAAAHENGIRRMTAAGVVPSTWLTTMLEWQRDWGRTKTYDAVMNVVMQHAGAYGQGVVYAHSMVSATAAG
jgi:nicotinamidase-related amidase